MNKPGDYPLGLTDNEKEIFIVFDVIDSPGGTPSKAREEISRRLHVRPPHRTTITPIFRVGLELFRKDPAVLTNEDIDEIIEKVGYDVSSSKVVDLHRLYLLWKIQRHKKTENKGGQGGDLLTFLEKCAEMAAGVVQEGEKVLPVSRMMLGSQIAGWFDKAESRVLRTFGFYNITGVKEARTILSVFLGAWFGEMLENVKLLLERRKMAQEQILTSARSGCEPLGPVELVDNNFALAAYHFLARGDRTWLEDNRFQTVKLSQVGPVCRSMECPRCTHQIPLQEWDTREFICPEHELGLVLSSAPLLPKPRCAPPYQELLVFEVSSEVPMRPVIPIEHLALEHTSKASLSLRVPKMLPFSEVVIAVGEVGFMPKLRHFVQDFLQTSPLGKEVRHNEERLQQSYAKLLDTLRSTPTIGVEQPDRDDCSTST